MKKSNKQTEEEETMQQNTLAIAEIDESLSLLRENWMNCRSDKKERYMKLIDKTLDERIVLMSVRSKKFNQDDS